MWRQVAAGCRGAGSDERIFRRPSTRVNVPLEDKKTSGRHCIFAALRGHALGDGHTHREGVDGHRTGDSGLRVGGGEGGKTCETQTKRREDDQDWNS